MASVRRERKEVKIRHARGHSNKVNNTQGIMDHVSSTTDSLSARLDPLEDSTFATPQMLADHQEHPRAEASIDADISNNDDDYVETYTRGDKTFKRFKTPRAAPSIQITNNKPSPSTPSDNSFRHRDRPYSPADDAGAGSPYTPDIINVDIGNSSSNISTSSSSWSLNYNDSLMGSSSLWAPGTDNVTVISVSRSGGCYSGFEMAFVGIMAAVMSSALIVTAVICCKELRRARKGRKSSCCEDLPLESILRIDHVPIDIPDGPRHRSSTPYSSSSSTTSSTASSPTSSPFRACCFLGPRVVRNKHGRAAGSCDHEQQRAAADVLAAGGKIRFDIGDHHSSSPLMPASSSARTPSALTRFFRRPGGFLQALCSPSGDFSLLACCDAIAGSTSSLVDSDSNYSCCSNLSLDSIVMVRDWNDPCNSRAVSSSAASSSSHSGDGDRGDDDDDDDEGCRFDGRWPVQKTRNSFVVFGGRVKSFSLEDLRSWDT